MRLEKINVGKCTSKTIDLKRKHLHVHRFCFEGKMKRQAVLLD